MRSFLSFSNHAARFGGLVLVSSLMIGLPALAAEKIEVLSVTASSTDGMLMDAVDGDATTAWQNKHVGEHDAWLGVHFADTAKLRGVRLLTDVMGADTALEIDTSIDGESYTPQLRNVHALKEKLELIFPKPVAALYLRVRFHYTGAKSAPRFRIRELEPLG
jgi:hypothetical protein